MLFLVVSVRVHVCAPTHKLNNYISEIDVTDLNEYVLWCTL